MSIKEFNFEGKNLPVIFVETSQVADGVECDVYKFNDDASKDLGIIKIKAGCKTPLQKVLKGERTVEGFISGRGKLTVTKAGGEKKVYIGQKDLFVFVEIGSLMQWQAAPDSDLEVYEICFPPYQLGRFANLRY